jgi:hypothetical protein
MSGPDELEDDAVELLGDGWRGRVPGYTTAMTDETQATTPDGGTDSPPQALLDALGDEIDDVRRRTADDDSSHPGEERLIEEGEVDRDQPVDDTIVPPG